MAFVFIDVVSVFGEIMLVEVCPKVTSTEFTATSSDINKLRYWVESLGWLSRAAMLIPLVHCLLLVVAYRLQFFRKWVMVLDLAVISVAVGLRYEPFYVETNESHTDTAYHLDEVGGILVVAIFWRVLRIVDGFYANEEAAAELAMEQADDALRVLLKRVTRIDDLRRTSRGDLEVTKQGLEVAVNGLIKIIDVNGDGDVSRDELVSGFRTFGADICSRAIASLIRRFDTDGSGNLDIQEFAAGIMEFYEQHRNEFQQTVLEISCIPDGNATGVQSSCELEDQMLVKASFYDRSTRRGSNGSNNSDAPSDAVTVPMLSAPVRGHGEPSPNTTSQWPSISELEDGWPELQVPRFGQEACCSDMPDGAGSPVQAAVFA
jgi:hypothetical protein